MKKIIRHYISQCKKVLKDLINMIKNILIFTVLILIKFYKFFISPILGSRCRFLPTCSEYCQDSLKKHGLINGIFYSLKRISKCHPFKILGAGDGIDLVPEKKFKPKGLN